MSPEVASVTFRPSERTPVATKSFNVKLRERRLGVMVHFDASASDQGALSWFKHPDCRVSYNFLVLDDGTYVSIAPRDSRAWHGGECKPSTDRLTYRDANSAFLGIAAATNQHESATIPQMMTLAWLCRDEFFRQGWPLADTWRVVGHNTEGWPRGRKIDPVGTDVRRPIIPLDGLRWLVEHMRMD